MARPRKHTALHTAEVKRVLRDLNRLSSDPGPGSLIELICSIMAADMKNQIPADLVSRAYKFISLVYKKFDTETLAGIALTRFVREGVPRSMDVAHSEIEGGVMAVGGAGQGEDVGHVE